jgi:hypothetical protein
MAGGHSDLEAMTFLLSSELKSQNFVAPACHIERWQRSQAYTVLQSGRIVEWQAHGLTLASKSTVPHRHPAGYRGHAPVGVPGHVLYVGWIFSNFLDMSTT